MYLSKKYFFKCFAGGVIAHKIFTRLGGYDLIPLPFSTEWRRGGGEIQVVFLPCNAGQKYHLDYSNRFYERLGFC